MHIALFDSALCVEGVALTVLYKLAFPYQLEVYFGLA